ncbi:HEAT repeat domain-containing protein [Vacuolonema iberomarrocanum]|uniref:HEAT repeat domain-containing protein n=1 Tax=Vacuolonema iberomarrocanum TaxID=3454632 RepID=UPI001A00D17D|nr:HEAT repeat domain-containing protein [filamentous cyanobacterium LEGE 07170]
MSDSSSSLIQAVEDADSAALLVAVQNLAAARLEVSIPTLVATLGYNNSGAAIAAVEGLIQLGEPAVPALLEQLDRQNHAARAWAICALAEIGDPRGFMTLLGAATADFSLQVRRAAARGLGTMKWQWFPTDLVEIAQEEAMEALLFVAQQDEEWIVRYSAIAGLEALATTIARTHPAWAAHIQTQLEQLERNDSSWAVGARARMAQQQQQAAESSLQSSDPREDASSLGSETNWQITLEKLYDRKGQERLVLAEGDPRRYRSLAMAISQKLDTT